MPVARFNKTVDIKATAAIVSSDVLVWRHVLDTVFVEDGLLLANHLQPTERVVRWLAEIVQSVGRTCSWITRYDGRSAMPPEWNDTGNLVNTSHVMTAIKLYEQPKIRIFFKKSFIPSSKKWTIMLLPGGL